MGNREWEHGGDFASSGAGGAFDWRKYSAPDPEPEPADEDDDDQECDQ